MEIIIYVLIALVVGVVVTFLAMRLRYDKGVSEQVRTADRLLAELQAAQGELARVKGELAEARASLAQLDAENDTLRNTMARLDAEKRAVEQRNAEQAQLLEQASKRCDELLLDITACKEQKARIDAEYNALQEKLDTQKVEMEKLHKLSLEQFKNMASDIMDEKTRAFKEMSGENLKTILEPLNRDIEGFKKQVTECYETENKERTSLQEQIRQLAQQNEQMRREADKLSSALRGGTKVQGDWGEMILHNILQQSGLREGEDFEVQKSVDAVGDNKRPDAVLHFPNHNDLIIDSKVSFTAYDSYMHADTDEARKQHARQHLDSVYNHVRQLAERDYSSRNKLSYDFVIMFIPIESMFLLALDEARAQGRNLWNEAYERRVIIMTPTNLVLAVRLLQDMWRQQRLEANIRAIKERAEKMYVQFASFATDIDAVRQSLSSALDSCDSARRRLTSGNDNLILQFEKMRRLGLEPKKLGKVAAQKSWQLLQEEAGVTQESITTDNDTSTASLQQENSTAE